MYQSFKAKELWIMPTQRGEREWSRNWVHNDRKEAEMRHFVLEPQSHIPGHQHGKCIMNMRAIVGRLLEAFLLRRKV
jgi:hypothetical protein